TFEHILYSYNSNCPPEHKRKMATSAALELLRAKALGGNVPFNVAKPNEAEELERLVRAIEQVLDGAED
ncbi:hypothetical protein, partial [Salinivibrio kushneri]